MNNTRFAALVFQSIGCKFHCYIAIPGFINMLILVSSLTKVTSAKPQKTGSGANWHFSLHLKQLYGLECDCGRLCRLEDWAGPADRQCTGEFLGKLHRKLDRPQSPVLTQPPFFHRPLFASISSALLTIQIISYLMCKTVSIMQSLVDLCYSTEHLKSCWGPRVSE